MNATREAPLELSLAAVGPPDWLGPVVLSLGVIFFAFALRSSARRRAARDRLYGEERDPSPDRADPANSVLPSDRLRRWLFLAGLDAENARSQFVTWTISAALASLLTVGLVEGAGLFEELETWVSETPGGLGGSLAPMVAAIPWVLCVTATAGPALWVRRRRRLRVREVERDLGTTLELLASLARAGLGLDASLDRVLRQSDPERALPRAFERFRRDLKGGRSRAGSLRAMSERLQISRVRTLVSALVQAERVGAGLANTLRQQADDLRQSQREQALAKAQALPAKLVFPLVVCFLPGIFVLTLGPAFFQFLQDTQTFEQPR